MRGSILKRCPVCRSQGNENSKCLHKEANYHIRYRYKTKQYSKCVGPNKKDAERLLAETISRINNGTFEQEKEITFGEFSSLWLRDHAAPRLKDSTLRNYHNMVKNRFIPYFGNVSMSSITAQKIQGLMASLRDGEFATKKLNPHTINKSLVLLKTMFKWARRWKYIKENPTEDVDRYKATIKQMDCLNPDEIRLLLKFSEEPFKTILLTALLTGLRRGELLGLQWGDVDWFNNVIHVRRSIFTLSKQEATAKSLKVCWKFIEPKSRNSVRKVVMSKMLKEALEIHKLNSKENSYDLIFTNRNGEPLDGQNLIHREFYPVLEAAGLRKIRWHDIRHTYTSLLIAQNENPKFIQSQLGHASYQTTMDRYGHLFPIESEKVGHKLDRQILPHSGNIGGTEHPEKLRNNVYQQENELPLSQVAV